MSLTVGANFSLLFSFPYTYLLSCILFLFALRYFVNYAPLFCTVCKFSYIVCYLTLFFTRVLRVYQCNSVRGSRFFFSDYPTTNPWYPQHLVIIAFFNFTLQWPSGRFVCIVTVRIQTNLPFFSLFVGMYFFRTLIVKHLLRHHDGVVFPGNGPYLFNNCPILLYNPCSS